MPRSENYAICCHDSSFRSVVVSITFPHLTDEARFWLFGPVDYKDRLAASQEKIN